MNGLASTDDLLRVMEQVSSQELSWFFRQWLNQAGVPSLEGSWYYDVTAGQVVVTVRQTQAGEPYRFSLGIGVSQPAAVLPRIQQMQVTGRDTTISIPSETEPASVVLDPGVGLLAQFGLFQKATN